jgi:predicted lipid-binding transport protein (Tim44 family)
VALARAGGGSNGGGGGLLYLIVLPFVVIYAWYVNRRINAKKAQADALLAKIAKKDPVWEESKLEAVVRSTFLKIEKAWCEQDLALLESLLDPVLFAEWKGRIEALAAAGQRNLMEGLTLDGVRIVEVKNYRQHNKDSFTVCLDAAATDYTVDRSGQIVDSNSGSRRKRAEKKKSHESFREFWTYERRDDEWLLLRVDQSDAWKAAVDAPLVDEG